MVRIFQRVAVSSTVDRCAYHAFNGKSLQDRQCRTCFGVLGCDSLGVWMDS
jgi:hypothetical protein